MDQTTATASQPKPALIIDTNAFIRCLDIRKLAEKYELFTSSNVLNEIKDKHAREKYLSLDIDIKTLSADDKGFQFTDDFSKRTGDYFSLSFTDKELIAISVSLINLRGKGELLRKQPPEMTEWIPKESEGVEEEEEEAPAVDDDGFTTVTKGKVFTQDDIKPKKQPKFESHNEKPEEKQEEQEPENAEGEGEDLEDDEDFEGEVVEIPETEDTQAIEGVVLEKINIEGQEKKDENAEGKTGENIDDDSEDEDDGKGWINPDNISKKLYKGTKKEDRIQEVGVVVMTADYSMQNVIIQMGIPLISTEGYTIKQTRRFVLECYCCHKICKNPTKQFCPSCGNPTLTKLSVHVNDDGTITYFRNPKKRISTRGKIYSIPKSVGGRSNNDLLLREDEFLMRGRLQKLERQEKDKDKKFKQRLQDYNNGLTFDDIRIHQKFNAEKLQIGYGKVNPNDRMQFRKKK